MTVSNVATGTIPTTDSKIDTTRKGLADSFDNFLVLLTTQLKNQDPTSPLDTNQFTQQIVSFTQVEQAVNTNENLQKLIDSNDTGQMNGAVSYLGKMVESEGNSFTLANGQGEFYYDLDDKANKTFITITDMSGKTVATGQGEVSAGKHKFVWDGKDQAGNPVRDGSYMIRVSAVDEAGDDVPVTTSVTNVVNSLSMVDGKPVLYVGDNSDVEVPLDKVLAVRFKDFF